MCYLTGTAAKLGDQDGLVVPIVRIASSEDQVYSDLYRIGSSQRIKYDGLCRNTDPPSAELGIARDR